MGAALFIVLNKKKPGFDCHVNGKVVARHYQKLEKLAAKLEIEALSKFESIDSQEEADFLLGEGFSEEEIAEMLSKRGGSTGADWHGPKEGLIVVRALIDHLDGKGKRTKNAADIVEDLRAFEEVLDNAGKRRMKFHLQWDI